MRLTYPLALIPAAAWNPTETGFVASFPDFDDAATQGETEPEALANARDLLATLIEDALEHARALPAPSAVRAADRLVAVDLAVTVDA